MKIQDRYASAIHSSNLKSKPETNMSDSDVLGAYGFADRRLTSGEGHYQEHPLAAPLTRLFNGSRNTGEVIGILTGLILDRSERMKIGLSEAETRDMARVILGWFRSPRCRACGGHGVKTIRGTTVLGDRRCSPCEGTGTIQIELLYRESRRELVRWAVARMEQESSLAGPEAMKALASRMDL